MEEKYVRLIQENLTQLVSHTHHLDSIIEKLSERKVFNEYMVKHLSKKKERTRKIMDFYEMIQGRGPAAFDNLLYALRETENFTAEQILSVYKIETYDNVLNLEPKMNELPSAEDIPDGSEELVVKIHPDRKFMDVDEENLPNGTYRMRSKPRGHALIINIYHTIKHSDRLGSDADTRRLEKLFKELGYEVFCYVDLTLEEMKKTIKKFSKNPELSKVDSVVVFIMAHGESHPTGNRSVNLIASDNQKLNTTWVAECFTSSNSSLVTKLSERKPKLLFFQACRMSENPEENQKINIYCPERLETDSLVTNKSPPMSGRNIEDIFLVFSTVEGQVSFRHRDSGALFVNKFCKIVMENAWQYDLETMIGMVDEEVRKIESVQYGFQTCEVTKFGVSRKVYFNPGL